MTIIILREEIWKLHQRLASIDTNQMGSTDNHPTSSINAHPISSIDTQRIVSTYTHPRESIDTHPIASLDTHPIISIDTQGWTSRPPIWTEEAAGFHKRVRRIHDPVKIVVPCAYVEASQSGLRFRDEVDKGPAEAASVDTDRIPSNDTNKPASIDITTSPSIDTGRISEQKEFDVCGNLRDGETTMRSDKFCQELQSAQQMLLKAIYKGSSPPYC
ncbi:hypothetical protein F2Q69_00035478 [Brassica cretica]|uniref:Uncharacterized protein n=1 Tax=Brassica cretica TaxID=69181 RepID=A0A8S9SNK7_BRACR|nr:hypothetical protein F2Q69_00035478 [Brassica cretica]